MLQIAIKKTISSCLMPVHELISAAQSAASFSQI